MKTQKNHLERQLQHSHDLAMHRLHEQEHKYERKMYKYAAIGTGIWLLLAFVCYLVDIGVDLKCIKDLFLSD